MGSIPFPPADNERNDTADLVIEYQRTACSKQDPGRISRFIESEQARFIVASKPWMATPTGSLPTSPFFEPIRVDDPKIKLASRNETAPIIDSEAARLIGSTSEPAVIPTKPTTAVHRAAKKGEMVLDDVLLRAEWTRTLGLDAKNAVQFGTSWILSGFENDYTEMQKGPAMVLACANTATAQPAPASPDAAPGIAPIAPEPCGWHMLAAGGEPQPGGGTRFTGDIASEMIQAGVGATVSQPGDKVMSATLHECPECGGDLEMRRSNPALDGPMDAFGYDTTEEKPLPKVFIQGYADIDVFPIGGGRVTHGFMPEVTFETVVPVDWLLERYEHARDVKGMSLSEMEELARWHPAGLEMWGYTGHSLAVDQKRWAAYRITIRQPFKDPGETVEKDNEEPLGRLMISANKVCLYNGPLMFEYETADGEKKTVPRMRAFPFANELQNNSIHGLSVTSRLISPQQALDAMMTQFQYDMATNGSPDLAIPKGANIEGQGDGLADDADDDGYSGIPNRIIRFDPDSGPPVKIGGEVTHHDWVPFTQGIVEHMQRATMQSQLDQGKSATGAPSASAQMYIGQRLDETRKPKGQRWAERLSNLFSYDLEIVVAVYVEKRQFKAIDALDNRTVRDFTGADLMGQTTVKVETKPSHDNEAFKRQNLLEALQIPGLIDMSNIRQRLKVAKALSLDDDVDLEPNQQVKDAQDEFLDFTLGTPPVRPVAKKRTDNHALHAATIMEELRSPAGEAMTRMWSMHELATDGWYDQFKALMLAERKMIQNPIPQPTEVVTDPATGDTNSALLAQQAKLWGQQQQLQQKLESMPKNTQDRIEQIQTGMIKVYPGFIAAPPEDQQDLLNLTVLLCHKDTHEWYLFEAGLDAAPPAPATQQGGPVQQPGPGAPPPQAPGQ